MFCNKCGQQIPDTSTFCTNCGSYITQAPQQPPYQPPYQQPYQPPYQPPYQQPARTSNASVILGIVGIVSAWLFALIGHITSIIGIVRGIKDHNNAGLVLSIIGEGCSIISSMIGIFMMT